MSATTRRRIIIDTDTASDDAVAIIMALAAPQLQVEAITVVAGNVPLARASINARYTLELCGSDIPVYEGCDRPWLREPATAEWFHGDDGMGNQHYPPPQTAAQPGHAVNELIRRFQQNPAELELITLGPLTNLATALAVEPSIAGMVRHCYIMGGAAATLGNVTPAAEYNIWCDPEAAHRVLHSGIPITLLGWELSCGEATLDDADRAAIRKLGTTRAALTLDSNATALQAVQKLQGQTGLALADPVAMAVAIDPAIALQQSHHHVTVSLDHTLTRGMTVVDINHVNGKASNATVCFSIDAQRWKKLLMASLH